MPVVDQIEPLAAKHAVRWAAWGHRTVCGLLAADGVQTSQASVFLDPPTRCNRVWQTDLLGAGAPRRQQLAYGGVDEDWATLCLACPVTTTQGTRDAVAALEAAIEGGPALRGDSPEKGMVLSLRVVMVSTGQSVEVDLWGRMSNHDLAQ